MEKKVLNYRIIIEPEKYKDGSTVYVAYCPTLGISDYGDTIEKVLKSIKDGVELAIEGLAKEKQVVPVDRLEEQIIAITKVTIPSGLKINFA